MKFVVASSEYFGKAPSMRSIEAPSLRHCLLKLITDDVEDEADFDHMTDDEIIAEFKDTNGDGQPHVMVFCVDTNEQVI